MDVSLIFEMRMMMKAIIDIESSNSTEAKDRIFRNLSRIMGIRVLDVDCTRGKILLFYPNLTALEMVYRELARIGCKVNSKMNADRREFRKLHSYRGRPMYT